MNELLTKTLSDLRQLLDGDTSDWTEEDLAVAVDKFDRAVRLIEAELASRSTLEKLHPTMIAVAVGLRAVKRIRAKIQIAANEAKE